MGAYTLPTDPIFISYSHDSEEHMRWVWKLAINFRRQGLKVIFDQDANPEPEKPDENIKSMLEFFRIHQRAAGVTPTGIFRSSVELPDDRELPARWRIYKENIYRLISQISECRFVLLIHTPRFFEETNVPMSGPHEAGLVLEEYVELHNSIARDPLKHRVISILRSGEKWHYGPANCRYFHLDFRENNTYARDLAILLQYLSYPPEEESWPSEGLSGYLQTDGLSTHRAIEYINRLSADPGIRQLGYSVLCDAFHNSTHAAVVEQQALALLEGISNKETYERIEKVALTYHHGTEAQHIELQPIFDVGQFAVARREGNLKAARVAAEKVPCLQLKALLMATITEDYHEAKEKGLL
jgi:hypothetical protein